MSDMQRNGRLINLRLGKLCCAFLLVCGIVGLMSSTARAQQQPLNAEFLLRSSLGEGNIGPQHREVGDAIEQFKKGAFIETRNLLESAKKKDPRIPPAGVMLAQLLYAAKQPELARAELERVVASDATDPESYLLFGEIAFQQRRFADAELSFQKAASLTSRYTQNNVRKNSMIRRAYSGLAGVSEVREDWTNAVKFLQPILKANPNDIQNTTRMARALFSQDVNIGDAKGKEKEAYDLLIQLFKANRATVRRPEITMGQMYQQVGNKPLSKQLMQKAAKEDASNLETQLTVARWALETGDNELAQSCSDRAVQINKTSVDAKLVSGLAARYQKNLSKAKSALEAAHLQSPSNLAALLQLAVVMVESNNDADKRTALEYSQVASRIYSDLTAPTGREAAVTSAWVLYRVGRQNDAVKLLQRALTGGSISAESSYYAAKILSQSNAEYSKQLLEKALQNERVFPARADAQQLLKSLGG